MPFLNELLQYKNDYFIETGTYQGETVDIALNNGFKNVYGMELSNVFYENCVKRFIYNKNVKIFKCNSRYDLYKIISNINRKITFWLDSHCYVAPDVGFLLCPILHELEQIKNHHIKTHTIMVDAIRLMNGIHFEVRKEQIEKKILDINPNYKIKYYNDQYSLNDVLVAYIDTQVNNTIIEVPKICIHKYLSKRKTNEQPPGLADFIRGSIALFNYSKKYNYDFYFDDSHPIFDNLLKNNHIIKNTIFDDTIELLPPKSYEQIDTEINALFLQNKSFCVMTNAFYTKTQNSSFYMENFGEISYECKKFFKQIFTPNQTTNSYLKDVYKILNLDSNSKYNIIHLRLGDNFIWNNTFDNNLFNNLNEKIKYILSINNDKQFVLLSDSAAMAVELKKHNPELFYWDNKKIHIGDLKNTNVQQAVKDTLIDFFIMTNCDKMFCYAIIGISGFSKLVSLIHDKEIININNMDTSQSFQTKSQQKNITVFGTCRLDSLTNYNNIIKKEISYSYDTKEILEIIKFIKYNHISPEQTITTFRTPMLHKKMIYSQQFKGVLEETDIFIIEICGRKTYNYNGFYVHNFLANCCSNEISQQIKINKQSDNEIENDILEIISELNTKKIIIVGHIGTVEKGERYELLLLLEKICLKNNILFINPVLEITKKGFNINNLVDNGEKIIHYNEKGHKIIKDVYEEYINKL